MAEASSAPVLVQLARFAAEASAAPVAERMAVHLGDGVLALLAGRRSPEGRALRDFFARAESGWAARLAADAACLRLSEVDDIHRASMVTPSAIALPVALALADPHQPQPQRLADAFMVGQALSVQLGLALGGAGLMAQGLWPSYLVAPFGAAATAGRMLGLSSERMAHALAMALAQTPASVGRSVGPRPARWLLFANAVRSGCLAALAAADGLEGDTELLSLAWLQNRGSASASLELLNAPAPVAQALSIKPHCAAKQTLSAIHAFQQLLAQGLDPATVEAVQVRVPPAYAAMIDREPPSRSRLASLVSVRWQLALAALRPAGLDDVAREQPALDAALLAWADKAQVLPDPSLAASYPQAWPALVQVQAQDRRMEVLAEHSPGDPALPWGEAELRHKAWRVLGNSPELELVELAFSALSEGDALKELLRRLA